MKVRHFIDSAGLYGAERILLYLAAEQLKRGLDVKVISYGSPSESEKAIEKEADKLGVPCERWRGRPVKRVLQEARACQGEVVFHSHGYKFNIIFAALGMFLRRVSCVSTVHGYTSDRRFTKLAVYYFLNKVSLRLLDGVAFVSEKSAEESRVAIDGNRRVLIENGIPDIGGIDSPGKPAVNEEAPYILFLGRLSEEKGADILLDAFDTVSQTNLAIELWLAGDGPQRQALESKAAGLECAGRIRFLGYREDARQLLVDARLLVIPSLKEGLPVTLLEAMALGVDVVSTRVGQIPTVMAHEETGYLLDSGSEEALVKALKHALNVNQGTYGQRAREVFLNRYTSQAMEQRYRAWYQQTGLST